MPRPTLVALTLVAAVTGIAAAVSQERGTPLLERARALHREVPLIDGHNDYPWALREHNPALDLSALDISGPQPSLMTDIPRLRAGGVGGQFWSVYVPATIDGPAAVRTTLEQIDVVHRMIARWPGTFVAAGTAAEVERAFANGRIASLIGVEGGHSIDASLATLRLFYALGARYMTLTHGRNTPWADSATDTPAHGGLTPFGVTVVREMNRLGMLVDLSHVSPDTMADAIDATAAPVIFSHSSARAVSDHPRNVPDDILRRLPQNGGVVMITFVPGFVAPGGGARYRAQQAEESRLRALHPKDAEAVQRGMASWRKANPDANATLSQVADHIDHVKRVAGIDHIGIGSDFDGINSVPAGLEDVSTYPALTAELLRRGYSDEDVKKILGLNVLRVMRTAEEVAARLKKSTQPAI